MFGLIAAGMVVVVGIPFFGCIAQKEFSFYAAGRSYLTVAAAIAFFSTFFYAFGSDSVRETAENWLTVAGGLLFPFGICYGISLARLSPPGDRRRKK